MITTNDLIVYLEDVLTSLKDETLSQDTKRELTLMYIKKKYGEKEEEQDDEKNLSYLSLGWYIHNFLLNEKVD